MVSPEKMFRAQKSSDYFHMNAEEIEVYLQKKLLADSNEIEFLIIYLGKFKLEKKSNKIIVR